MSRSRYVVAGGGIVGASVAYHLGERTDTPVVVYERGDLAGETTRLSTAMVGVDGSAPYYRLKEYGFRLYNEFFADPAANPRYRQAGRLRVSTSAGGARELADRAAAARDRDADCGTQQGDAGDSGAKKAYSPVMYLPGEKLDARLVVPPLDTSIVEGALYRPLYGYVREESRTLGARELALEFVERARAHGVTFETDTEVTDVVTDGDRVVGVETNGGGTTGADAVVCAAGPWTDTVAEYAGLDLPLGYAVSPVYRLDLDDPLPYSLPMVKSHDSTVGVHPKRDDAVLVTYVPGEDEHPPVGDPSAVGDAVLDEFRGTALREARRLLPVLDDAELTDEWVGVGARTPDGHPIAGWTSVGGLSLAVTMSGIQYAPAVGRIVARQLVDDDPTEYYDAVSVSRFDGYADCRRTGDGS